MKAFSERKYIMNKKLIISISLIIGIFASGILAGYAVLSIKSIGISTGLCLFSDNGSCFVIKDNSPVKLSPSENNPSMFSAFSDGDKILVFHSGINETYPASTGAYLCIKLSDGERENVPEEVVSSLTHLGWLSEAGSTKEAEFTQDISVKREYGNISFRLPDGWDYKEIKNTQKPHLINIEIFRKADPGLKIEISHTDAFGVCGTGLTTREENLSSYKITKGIYDNNPYWDYIVFEDTPGYYVIYNHMSSEKYKSVSEEIDAIFSTIKIAEGICFREEALKVAQKLTTGENKPSPGEFDLLTGIWTFVFDKEETEEIIKINSLGEIISPAQG